MPYRKPKKNVAVRVSPEVMEKLAEAPPVFNRTELLTALIDGWGGVVSLARDIHADYEAAQPGSMSRQRIAALVCQLISLETAAQDEKRRPTDQLTEEEIRAGLVSLLPVLKIGVGDNVRGRSRSITAADVQPVPAAAEAGAGEAEEAS